MRLTASGPLKFQEYKSEIPASNLHPQNAIMEQWVVLICLLMKEPIKNF